MPYSNKFISMLRCQSLERIMAANGYYPSYERKGRLYYHCPFHNDTHPSFSIETKDAEGSHAAQRFTCPSCKTEGCGTLELEALFLNKEKDNEETISKVASIFGFILEGWEDADFYNRRSEAPPQAHYSFEYNDSFSDNELEALGCQRRMVYSDVYDEEGTIKRIPLTDKEGKPRYIYSWGNGFFQKDISRYVEDDDYVNFDRRELTRIFNLRSVRSFITGASENRQGEKKSYRIESSVTYPIFNFEYGEGNARWGKKYEPYYRPGHKGIKFMFWYNKGANRSNIGSQIYGDIDVIKYLSTGNVNDIQDTKPEGKTCGLFSRTEQDDEGNTIKTKVFRHLVICSGPRDAINVYFHSNAHVVWFNSETADFSRDVFRKLKTCSENIYICYDIDNTGVRCANELAMKHLGLKVIRLPKTLENFTDPRTGKPGKDAENFFNLYRPGNKWEKNPYYGDVDMLFATMMNNSVDMRFFQEVRRKSKKYGGESFIDYELVASSALQFIGAKNIKRYKISDEKYIYVRNIDNIVDIIPEKEVPGTVRQEMLDFAKLLDGVKDFSRLTGTITKSEVVKKDFCQQLPETELDLHSWDEDTEYFPFQNCVVKVTKDGIQKKQYSEVPYQFFRSSIIQRVTPRITGGKGKDKGAPLFQNQFQGVETPTFRIYKDVAALQAKRAEIDSRITRGMGDEERETLESQYLEFEKLWAWRLEWLIPYQEQPIAVRLVYETGRIHWKKEKYGVPLSPLEQQEQDLHFIVKCNTFGYQLARHRDKSSSYITYWTDYDNMFGGKASGRTGKTVLANLKSCLRNVLLVNGKGMKTKENFAKNFAGFRFGIHSNILIDDLDSRVDDEQFYNLNTSMDVKTMYEDEITITGDDCPKVDITGNKAPRMDSSSTEGRFLLVPVGGPIGFHKINGQTVEISIRKMFGVNIPDGLNEKEYSFCQNFLLWCLQFYLTHKEIIKPYMGHDGLAAMAAQKFRNKDFWAWATEFFSDEENFGKQLNRREMFLDYQEYIGKETSIYGNNMAMKEFKELLHDYCLDLHYSLMPLVCYSRDKTGEKDESVRLSSWISKKDANGFRIKKNGRITEWIWSKGERCIYVFRSPQDIPSNNQELHRQSKDLPPANEESDLPDDRQEYPEND